MKDNEKKGLTVLTERVILGQVFRIYGTVEKPLFLVADIARAIDHSTPSKLANIVDAQNKLLLPMNSVPTQDSHGGLRANTEYLFVTEAGLYKILMRSDKPKAQPFQDKVCEILKEIRQTGGYIHTEPDDDDDMIIARALIAAQRKIEMRDKQLATAKEEIIKQQEEIAVLKPKSDYCDLVLTAENTFSASEVAAQLGIRSATSLNRFLVSVEFIKAVYKKQFDKKTGKYKKVIAHYLLRADYVDKGLGDVVNVTSKSKDGSKTYSNLQLRYTTKGVKFIYELIKEKAPELLGNKNNREAD